VSRWARRAALAVLLGLGTWHGAQGLYIEAKAHVAQRLVLRAWRAARAGARHARPWPWADTEPVARLRAPGQDVDLVVLAGASGRTLAFGPGHLSGTPLPGEDGNAVLSGHRDTHFAFLRRLRPGDELAVERRDGALRRYVVTGAEVVDRSEVRLLRDTGDTRLTLVTCYPFATLRPGGPLRYVVTARLAEPRILPSRMSRAAPNVPPGPS
jgi:sortase A